MNSEKTAIQILRELNDTLKLEDSHDADLALVTIYPDKREYDINRVKYARKIIKARKLLGLSNSLEEGALIERREVDEVTSLLGQ